jgi:hypothetical protein
MPALPCGEVVIYPAGDCGLHGRALASQGGLRFHFGSGAGSRSMRMVSGAEAIILPIAASHW